MDIPLIIVLVCFASACILKYHLSKAKNQPKDVPPKDVPPEEDLQEDYDLEERYYRIQSYTGEVSYVKVYGNRHTSPHKIVISNRVVLSLKEEVDGPKTLEAKEKMDWFLLPDGGCEELIQGVAITLNNNEHKFKYMSNGEEIKAIELTEKCYEDFVTNGAPKMVTNVNYYVKWAGALIDSKRT